MGIRGACVPSAPKLWAVDNPSPKHLTLHNEVRILRESGVGGGRLQGQTQASTRRSPTRLMGRTGQLRKGYLRRFGLVWKVNDLLDLRSVEAGMQALL